MWWLQAQDANRELHQLHTRLEQLAAAHSAAQAAVQVGAARVRCKWGPSQERMCIAAGFMRRRPFPQSGTGAHYADLCGWNLQKWAPLEGCMAGGQPPAMVFSGSRAVRRAATSASARWRRGARSWWGRAPRTRSTRARRRRWSWSARGAGGREGGCWRGARLRGGLGAHDGGSRTDKCAPFWRNAAVSQCAAVHTRA